MNLLLPMFLYIGGIWILGAYTKSIFKDAKEEFFKEKNFASMNVPLIGEGGKSKAKILDKKPVTNPDVANQNNADSNYMQGGANALPDMRGVYGNGNDIMSQAGGVMPQAGGGMGVSAMIGVVNAVGLSNQTGNISNNLIAAQQVVGGVRQQGNYISNETKKGSKSISQNAATMVNEYRGRRTSVSHSGNSTNTLTGKTSISSTGATTNLIYGAVSKVRSGSGDIKTEMLHIKGASKTNSLYAQKLYAPKAKRIKIQELNSQGGENVERKGIISRFKNRRYVKDSIAELDNEYTGNVSNRRLKKPNVTINNIILQDEKGKPKRFTLNKNTQNYEKFVQNVMKEAGIQEVESSGGIPTVTIAASSNAFEIPSLNTETESNATATASNENTEGVPMANVVPNAVINQNANSAAMLEMFRAINTNQRTTVTENNVYNKKELSKMAVEMMPHQNIQIIREAKQKANDIARNRELESIARANVDANRRVNVGDKNKTDLDTMLKDTNGTAGPRFQKYIDEQFGEELHKEPSKEEMKAIEEQARENVSKRQDVPLDEKERQEEERKEKEKLLNERTIEQRIFIEEKTKETILQDQKSAEIILGKENAEILQNKMSNNERERDLAAISSLVKKELKDQEEYKKKHPEHSRSSYDDIYRLRRQEMMKNDLQTAVNQINTQGQNNGADANSANVIPNTAIYIAKQAREATTENEDVDAG